MKLEPVNPEILGKPWGFSHGMIVPAGSRLLMVAGQVAWDERQQIVSDDFAVQFGRALANVLAVVSAAGGGPEHVARLLVFVTTKDEYLRDVKRVGVEYRAVMGRHYPAMALVEVRSLLDPRAKVEIEGIAAVP